MRLFTKLYTGWLVSLAMILPAAAAETATGEGHAKVFPPFDTSSYFSTLFWLAILFGLMYRLLSRRALPRIAEIKRARREQIDRDLASAAAMQKKAEEAESAYSAALAKSKADAQATAAAARDVASAEADKRRTAVEAELSTRMIAAEAQIAASKATAMSNVADIATDAAAEIVRQITGTVPAASELKSAIASLAKS